MIPLLEQRFTHRHSDQSDLAHAVLGLQSAEAINAFLHDLCTSQEVQMLHERWTIAKLIQMGFPYRVINQKTGASSATISRVSQNLTKGTGALLDACKRRQEAITRQLSPRP